MKNPLFQKIRPHRVRRGGSWYYFFGRYAPVSARYYVDPTYRRNFLGFRLFRTLEKR
jgi:formylglycine-generating enzyme required for sulfatase activity